MSVQTYIVYEDSQGKLGAVLDPHDASIFVDFWMEGKKVVGCPAAKSEQDAINYTEVILSRYPNDNRKRIKGFVR